MRHVIIISAEYISQYEKNQEITYYAILQSNDISRLSKKNKNLFYKIISIPNDITTFEKINFIKNNVMYLIRHYELDLVSCQIIGDTDIDAFIAANVESLLLKNSATERTAAIFINKFITYEKLLNSSILQPKTLYNNKSHNACFKYLTSILGAPFVAKPIHGSGGRGVFIVKSNRQFNELKIETSGFENYIFQESIKGELFQADAIIENGEIFDIKISALDYSPEKYTGGKPALCYTNDKCYSILDKASDFLRKIISTIGFLDGPAHLEFFSTKQGFVFIEMSPRFPGTLVIDRYQCQFGDNFRIKNILRSDYIAPHSKQHKYGINGLVPFQKGKVKSVGIDAFPINSKITAHIKAEQNIYKNSGRLSESAIEFFSVFDDPKALEETIETLKAGVISYYEQGAQDE